MRPVRTFHVELCKKRTSNFSKIYIGNIPPHPTPQTHTHMQITTKGRMRSPNISKKGVFIKKKESSEKGDV